MPTLLPFRALGGRRAYRSPSFVRSMSANIRAPVQGDADHRDAIGGVAKSGGEIGTEKSSNEGTGTE